MAAAVDYCSAQESRPAFTGVHLFLGEKVKVAGADGFRLAFQTLPASFPAEAVVIIPRGTVKTLAHLWDKLPPAPPLAGPLIKQITARRELQLGLDKKRLRITFGRVTFIAQLIEGSPPNYEQLIPTEVSQEVWLFAPDLERAVRRLKEIASDASGEVRLTWTETSLTATAKSKEKGEVTAQVLVQATALGRMGINVVYLLDYLNGKEGVVTMGTRGAQDPVLFRHSTSPLVLIMPMFVQW